MRKHALGPGGHSPYLSLAVGVLGKRMQKKSKNGCRGKESRNTTVDKVSLDKHAGEGEGSTKPNPKCLATSAQVADTVYAAMY